MCQILFFPLVIFDSYVNKIQNKLFFGTIRRILTLTNLAVTSWAFSCFLSPGLYGKRQKGGADKCINSFDECMLSYDRKFCFFGGGAYGSLPDAVIWWGLRTGGGGVLTSKNILTPPESQLHTHTSHRCIEVEGMLTSLLHVTKDVTKQ